MSENKPPINVPILAGISPVQLERIILDTDFKVLQRFIFRALALQHEQPELADLFTPEQVPDVRLLYELLEILQSAKSAA